MISKNIVSALGGALVLAASFAAFAGPNDDPLGAPQDLAVGGAAPNQSAPLCTVAVNSTGTIAGGTAYAASSALLGTGIYEVIFKGPCGGNITAARGWARFVQADTLSTGSLAGGVSCTTADRAGNTAGVFIQCANASGALTNTSFFLMVTR
jgi:hypothetical protein